MANEQMNLCHVCAGGYLAFQILEVIRGKKIEQDVEKGIMASGFLLLTSLGFFLIVRDALNLSQSLHL